MQISITLLNGNWQAPKWHHFTGWQLASCKEASLCRMEIGKLQRGITLPDGNWQAAKVASLCRIAIGKLQSSITLPDGNC
ncbi:hypothetical protein [uncultured Duncaniella sp.]|uniref:hypothetical protein n=1 Tax=uncultured Duncaniella sp. TaxID=2768039 RepID=UPI0026382A32|nr:hypothetical protein [uncultured Duncaniella sp.]